MWSSSKSELILRLEYIFKNFIYDFLLKWYRFDDTIVAKVSPEEAVSANFGGEKSNQHALPGTNAYLLIYVKKSAIGKF